MASLETRVEKLESTVGGDTPIIRTIIHFVRPGELDAPIAIVRAASGMSWTPAPGEDDEALIARAWRDAGSGDVLLHAHH